MNKVILDVQNAIAELRKQIEFSNKQGQQPDYARPIDYAISRGRLKQDVLAIVSAARQAEELLNLFGDG